MLVKEKKLIVTYYTSSMAFATEKACAKELIAGKLISAPREVSADCGISFATGIENREKLIEVLRKYNVEYDKIVELEI